MLFYWSFGDRFGILLSFNFSFTPFVIFFTLRIFDLPCNSLNTNAGGGLKLFEKM